MTSITDLLLIIFWVFGVAIATTYSIWFFIISIFPPVAWIILAHWILTKFSLI